MRFEDVIGHHDIKRRLRDMADSGRIPHALMLAGKQGIGKMRMARAFVQYIACTSHVDGDACGKCPACRQVENLNFPDVNYVFPIVKKTSPKRVLCADYADEWRAFLSEHSYMPMREWMTAIDAGNSQPSIYVTESTEILRRLSLSAYSSRYKVTVIWLPERMNDETANKLLKMIEEPYADSLFVMVSNEPEKIIATIRSRVQTLNMLPLSPQEIAGVLMRDCGVSEEEALAAARLAEGSYARALDQLAQGAETVRFRDLFQDMMRRAYARDVVRLKEIGEEVAAMGRVGACRFLAYVATMLRENLIYNLRNPELNLLSAEEEAFSQKFSPFVNEVNITPLARAVDEAARDITGNANAKIVCFDLMLKVLMHIRRK